MPYDRTRYPADWDARARAVKDAADWKCQRCGAQCRRPGEPFDTHRRTLTVAHLDHDPENDNARLEAMCAPCHLRYDAPEKARRRRERTA
jgi:5-methylcytosine-specific restriction endonuclease McrA